MRQNKGFIPLLFSHNKSRECSQNYNMKRLEYDMKITV